MPLQWRCLLDKWESVERSRARGTSQPMWPRTRCNHPTPTATCVSLGRVARTSVGHPTHAILKLAISTLVQEGRMDASQPCDSNV